MLRKVLVLSIALGLSGVYAVKVAIDNQAEEKFNSFLSSAQKNENNLTLNKESVSYNPFNNLLNIRGLTISSQDINSGHDLYIENVVFTPLDDNSGIPEKMIFELSGVHLNLNDIDQSSYKDDDIDLLNFIAGEDRIIELDLKLKATIDSENEIVKTSSHLSAEGLGKLDLSLNLNGLTSHIQDVNSGKLIEKQDIMRILSGLSLSNINFELGTVEFKDFMSYYLERENYTEDRFYKEIDIDIEKFEKDKDSSNLASLARAVKEAYRNDKNVFLTASTQKPIDQQVAAGVFISGLNGEFSSMIEFLEIKYEFITK